MDRTAFIGADQANRAFNANVSPRYRRLENFERWVDGTQYDGLPDWFTGGPREVPLWERAPVIVYPAVQISIRSNVDLVFGEGRFPEITSKPGEDEDEEDNGTDEDAAESLDRFLREYHKLCRFKSHCRDAFAAAQGCGTAVAIHGHRDGVPFAELIPAKWGTPRLGIDGSTEVLEIRYPYLDEYREPDGRWAVRAKLYRRVIDDKNDITFLPADASENGTEPNWVQDTKRTIEHNLGFCPVIWYPFMRGCAPVNQIDGAPIHASLLDEIRGHDIALSQKHRCALLAEPQPWETGVAPGFNPTDSGHVAAIPATQMGGDPRRGDNTGPDTGMYITGQAAAARKKGPGWMWSYPNVDTKLGYLEFPAPVLKAMEDHCHDLLAKIEDGLCVTLPKPEQFKFAQAVSGKSLELVKQRQYDRCDQYRDDLTDHFLIPSVKMQLRIAERVGPNLKVPGIADVSKALAALVDKNPNADTEPKSQPDAA